MSETTIITVDLNKLRDSLREMIEEMPRPLEREKLPGEPPRYVVRCRGELCSEYRTSSACGDVELTTEQYVGEMTAAHRGWSCPHCGGAASFLDTVFENWLAWAEKNDPRALEEGNE